MYVADAAAIAEDLVGDLHPRWEHVQGVGRCAEQLAITHGLPQRVVVAAWLHDIGYGRPACSSGFHPLDGARYLQGIGVEEAIVSLVAWHTGAGQEAHSRGLLAQLSAFDEPDQDDLDALTLIDLATSPTGAPVRPRDRITEILTRYEPGHPVHDAVTRSRPGLLAICTRAKTRFGLPVQWPAGAAGPVLASAAHGTAV